MGQYRHVTDLRSFAAGLRIRPEPLRLVPADGNDADPPAPTSAHVDAQFDGRGRPLLEYRILRAAVLAAVEKGVETVAVTGRTGKFIEMRFGPDMLSAVAFDDQFEAATARGDAVVEDGAIYIRVDAGPVLN